MYHSIELQLVDFSFPLLLTLPSFLMKNLTFCFAGKHLIPPIGLFGGKDHILFTAYNFLNNSENEPSGIADNTCAHPATCDSSSIFCFLMVGRGGEIRTEVFFTNM